MGSSTQLLFVPLPPVASLESRSSIMIMMMLALMSMIMVMTMIMAMTMIMVMTMMMVMRMAMNDQPAIF